MELADKVAIVTGAHGDIGAATARRFLKEGARLVLSVPDPAALEGLRQEQGRQDDRVAVVGIGADEAGAAQAVLVVRWPPMGAPISSSTRTAWMTVADGAIRIAS
jgi:NAD(P)-dependent dehydrogenase (short-subunit alcohol dehydrogenase family)